MLHHVFFYFRMFSEGPSFSCPLRRVCTRPSSRRSFPRTHPQRNPFGFAVAPSSLQIAQYTRYTMKAFHVFRFCSVGCPLFYILPVFGPGSLHIPKMPNRTLHIRKIPNPTCPSFGFTPFSSLFPLHVHFFPRSLDPNSALHCYDVS